MLKTGTILYDLQGNEVLINEIRGGSLNTTVTRTSTVSFNNGRNVETQTFRDNRKYSLSDFGILLYCRKEDKSKEPIDLCNDEFYKFNADKIREYWDAQFAKIYNDIKKDAPLQAMSSKDKEVRISSYYSIQKSMKEEEDFYKREKSEYFGRIDIDTEFYRKNYKKYLYGHYYDRIYISKIGYHTIDNTHVVDWRAPIASLYYDNEKTSLSSNVYVDAVNSTLLDNPFNVYNYELMLKRRYSFNPLKYINLYVAGDEFYSQGTVDPFLMEVLAEKRSDHKISDIIKSIQSNQNRMIRQEHNKSMIVQGCAGSGKTMILLHRLSYLKFNKYVQDLSKVKIITPNNLFNLFISDLSHSLELDEIEHTIIEKYYMSLARKYQELYYTENRKDIDGKIIKSPEVPYNKAAQKYIGDLSKNLLSPEGYILSDLCDKYYTHNTITNIKMEYEKEITNLKHSINSEEIVAIAERLGLGKNIKESLMEYLESIYLLCDREINYANNKIIDQIEKIENRIKQLVNSKEKIAGFMEFLDAQKAYFEREFGYGRSINAIINELIDLNSSLYTYENIYKVAKEIHHQIEKDNYETDKIKIQLLEVHEQKEKYNNAIKERPFWDFASKLSLRIRNRQELNMLSEKGRRLSKLITESTSAIKKLEDNFASTIEQISFIKSEDDRVTCISIIEKAIIDLKIKINDGKEELKSFSIFRIDVNTLNGIATIFSSKCKEYVINFINETSHQDITKTNILTKEVITIINNTFKDILSILTGFSIEGAIPAFSSEMDEVSILQKSAEMINKYLHAYNSALLSILEIGNCIAETKKDNEFELSQQIELLQTNHTILLNDHELSLINNCKTILYKRGQFVVTLFDKMKNNLRQKFSIKCNDNAIFKHDLFILLYIYYLHCGELRLGDKHLFIDEGQDYSYYEYELLHLVNGKQVTFNIFGDLNQLLLSNRGITDWKRLVSELNASYYELNENYRNTVEITEFCNRRFDYRHTPIGIRGPEVETIAIDNIIKSIKREKENNTQNRIAIICNDSNMDIYYEIMRLYSSDDKFLIGTVKDVKGLEFDVVFVIPGKMARNESYISYTRALNHLYIAE